MDKKKYFPRNADFFESGGIRHLKTYVGNGIYKYIPWEPDMNKLRQKIKPPNVKTQNIGL